MAQRNEIKLAERILQLDKLRDELYEELLQSMGSKGNELLRRLQNAWCLLEGGNTLATQLRKGLDRLKKYYIKKLTESDFIDSSVKLQSLTISELASLYKKSIPTKK